MFSEKERKVFSHVWPAGTWEGGERWYDPLAVRRDLLLHLGGRLDDVWEKAAGVGRKVRAQEARRRRALAGGPERDPDVGPAADFFSSLDSELVTPEECQAEGVLLKAARLAFGVPDLGPAADSGPTDQDVWDCLSAYSRWLQKKSATPATTPTPSPATDSPPGGASATASGSASTSTSAA